MAIRRKRESLEDFALKGMHLAKMTGISLGVHAIPDAFLLMHTGVGCKYKAAAQIANHDWGSHPNRREAWTQVAELQLIQGSSERIGPFARSWYERRRPDFMVVTSAYFIELTGEDHADAVVATEAALPCDMGIVKTAAPNGGFFEGYAAVMLEVLKKTDLKAPPTRPGAATILGWFYNRYEPDQEADVQVLRDLCERAGVDLGPVLLSGRPYKELLTANEPQYVIQMPYARPVQRKLKRMLRKRDVIELDPPMGITATKRFVRMLAQFAGSDLDAVTAWAEAEEERTREQLEKVSSHLRNCNIAVFADPVLAAGMVSLLHEMGVPVPLVGLRDSHGALGGKVTFLEILARNGISDVSQMEIVNEPSLRYVKQSCLKLMREGRLRGVIGSSHELDTFQHTPRTMAMSTNTFLLEVGFPSDRRHSAVSSPSLGFQGTIDWAQRILDAAHMPRLGASSHLA